MARSRQSSSSMFDHHRENAPDVATCARSRSPTMPTTVVPSTTATWFQPEDRG